MHGLSFKCFVFLEDSCVDVTEYETMNTAFSHEMAVTLFNHLDVNKDQCIKIADRQAEYHLIDTNR